MKHGKQQHNKEQTEEPNITPATMFRSTISNDCPVPRGTLFIIGGKEDKGETVEELNEEEKKSRLEVLGKFIELTGKEDRWLR